MDKYINIMYYLQHLLLIFLHHCNAYLFYGTADLHISVNNSSLTYCKALLFC